MRQDFPSDDHLRIIAENVRTMRAKRGLTQADLARESGVSRALISRIERSSTSIRLTSLFRIAKALRVRVRDLVSYHAPKGADR